MKSYLKGGYLNKKLHLYESLTLKYPVIEPPLRSVLFSCDQMRQHGKVLAGTHSLSPGHSADQRLLTRLTENEQILLEVRTLLSEAIKSKRSITPAGEWLLDNFYLIEEQIRTARKHLPKGYSRELPQLRNGSSAGLPRVYDMALETISHGDGKIDAENLSSFAAAYQSVSILKLGELWAIPIMLRLALIENIRRVSLRIASDMAEQSLADFWADRMTETAENDLKSLIIVIAEMVHTDPTLGNSFVAELSRRLQGQSSNLALPLTWIEQRLLESGSTIKQVVQREIQQQAADQVSMSNSIGSLRFLGAMDWREFVETMSLVDQTLSEDPGGFYRRMDFITRDRYRHVVEKAAKRSGLSEVEVARHAIILAKKGASEKGIEDRIAHVGYYLIDKGSEQLDLIIKPDKSFSGIIKNMVSRFPLLIYAGSITLLTVLSASGLMLKLHETGLHGWLLWLSGIVLLLSVSHLTVAIVNLAVTLLAVPHPLPRLDFSNGIPSESRTLAVVPAMIIDKQNIENLAEAIEVRFLANQDDNLYFALLTDFRDAKTETMPDDAQLLNYIRLKIEDLNEKYRDTEGDRFFLFHRPRLWNPGEKIWMGYERKRGKLTDLNSYLRGKLSGSFSLIIGNTDALANVKYVITLDTDTQLPRDSARQFAGAMSHPLNHAKYDKLKQRIVEGYGIIQPRVVAILQGANRSRYAQLCGSESGIDPYTRTVSDVYQDLFSEGSYIGKGIYDVDAFEVSLSGKFPENLVLSHDLLEGCYARSGLLSDVQLIEEYPSKYSSDVNRRRRWIRGDWQIIRWVFPFIRGLDGHLHKNPVSGLSRLKIFDNLRRSLVQFALMLMLLTGWTIPGQLWFWTLTVIGIIFIPSILSSFINAIKKPDDLLWRQHILEVVNSAGRRFSESFFLFICMPYEASYSLNAIVCTLWRMLITHKNLLEWNTADGSGGDTNSSIADSYRAMKITVLIAGSAGSYLYFHSPDVLLLMWPILGLWLLSPLIVWWISRPFIHKKTEISEEQRKFLLTLSRKTWAFFETFVGPEDNWLPPDNFQEIPAEVIAHRTSPTNIGFALLANLTAYDFGYITAGESIERTSHTLDTLDILDRYHGHFYNWYDTMTLEPLEPRYISTVDSGNLAAYLLTLRSGLLELPDNKIIQPELLNGILDTVNVLAEKTGIPSPVQLVNLKTDIETACKNYPETLSSAWTCYNHFAASALEFSDLVKTGYDDQVVWWAQALVRQIKAILCELTIYTPWAGSSDKISRLHNLDEIPTLRQVVLRKTEIVFVQEDNESSDMESIGPSEIEDMMKMIKSAADLAAEKIADIESLASHAGKLAIMEFDFLYDKERHLLAIGYNVNDRRRDSSFYDLLASEARLCSFVVIAQGQLPQENWFALGRQLTMAGGKPVLMSWSGSMFEYLMPLLIMPAFESSLLEQSYNTAVNRQIEYGSQLGVPWGVSESGYYLTDANQNYQYQAFGVPGLGLKRGLVNDLVIAPYASALALMVSPEEACANLQYLESEGFSGKYGLYEAIDYTASRLPHGEAKATIRSFMAHHQGMTLLALSYLLHDRPMQRRFMAEQQFMAAALLLQEKIPKATAFYSHTSEIPEIRQNSRETDIPVRILNGTDTPFPEVQLLSNGRYKVMVTNSGGGYSHWKDIAVTRWREDGTCDNRGSFCYIRDSANGEFWSTTYQPTLKQPKYYEVIFSEGRAEFRRSDNGIDAHTSIVVSPEDDIELRRTRMINRSRIRREIDITSYAEVVLGTHAADAMHPAFGNLFVKTEIYKDKHAILCHRRPRSLSEKTPWFFHQMTAHGVNSFEVSYETDRSRFIGRWNTTVSPAAMTDKGPLSDSEGSVLDPIASIRYSIFLEPEESITIDIVSGIGKTRQDALNLIMKYQDQRLADRVFDLAWTHSQVVLRQLNATEADAQLYGHLAGSIIFANSSMRADPGIIARNQRGQSGLWGYSISGDVPIVLLKIQDPANINLARQLIQAHNYWRIKGLIVDLVIWNEDHSGYRQVLHDLIVGLLATGEEFNMTGHPGGVFVRSSDQISEEDRTLIQTTARAILSDSRGKLADQINRRASTRKNVIQLTPVRSINTEIPVVPVEAIRDDLIFYNGYGGFTPDGREYIVTTAQGKVTPAPWVNVIANAHFGTVISESGHSYTWGENAHEFRLTPWYNDPVSDNSGEAFYIRDEERGHYWSPMPLPGRGSTPYLTRHGFGYSVFEHTERGIRSETWIYVALDASVKFTVVKIKNLSGRTRRMSVTGYTELVLGDLRSKTAMHVVTELDPESGALFARNGYSMDFAGRVAFFDTDDTAKTVSGDRVEFIGRNGTLEKPAAMRRVSLSGRTGAALDPCAAIQVPFDLAAGEEKEIIFKLGLGRDADDAGVLVRRFRGSYAAKDVLDAVWQYWNHTLGTVQVETPDQSLNIMANGWLLYQTLACRMWARSGFYQSGGAFGFRDQLQDSMALIHAEPGIARAHILLCAAHQFTDGDVQHWWHPPSNRGVRTHCSDDFLWLPMVTNRYVLATGDTGVLDEPVAFVEGREVNPDEESYYDLPIRSNQTGTLYEHCVRAILKGENYGEHGLPLIGAGDWNDGMNNVGGEGKGESIWLGFFYYEVLIEFSAIAIMKDDQSFAEFCKKEAAKLREQIELNGWDGEWYRRAYFDDGTPLGSADNKECQIDSIAQSWSVLSGAGEPGRSRISMESLDKRLVRRDYSLIQLLDPPFDSSDLDPGYIKGYVPGVRENGGQYTHAAIWAAMAFAKLGDKKRAWELMSMINPVNHAKSPQEVAVYKVEPYVIAADVYAMTPHTGRGGWTWYTGSAGWMYRLVVESLLGLRLEIDKLRFEPCIPEDWESFKIHYRYRETTYHISIIQIKDVSGTSITLDNVKINGNALPLINDRREHWAEFKINPSSKQVSA
jgi:cellobiose phosphorylase